MSICAYGDLVGHLLGDELFAGAKRVSFACCGQSASNVLLVDVSRCAPLSGVCDVSCHALVYQAVSRHVRRGECVPRVRVRLLDIEKTEEV